MLTLFFISDNPLIEPLRAHFQQFLKLRIAVVRDFDHGLKEIYDKRPLVACLQDRIAGLTAENVARHLQLLLGNGAPAFILLQGSPPTAPAPADLFSRTVDLTQPFEAVCRDLQQALQQQLGAHWAQVYEPPGPPAANAATPRPDQPEFDAYLTEDSIFRPSPAGQLPGTEPSDEPEREPLFVQDAPGGPPAEPMAAAPPPRMAPTPPAPDASHQPTPQPLPPKPVAAPVPQPEKTADPVAEALLVMEKTYHARQQTKRHLFAALLLLLALVAAGIWWWIGRQPDSRRGGTVVAPPPQQRPATLATTSATRNRPTVPTRAVTTLPPFIPATGHDTAFAATHPGWERYRSRHRDYRLFYEHGRLKALQTLTVEDGAITTAELRQALVALTGSDRYRLTDRERRGGLLLEHAVIPGRAELIIYRTGARGSIQAYVLELFS